MPRFSANLGFLWTDRPLPDAIHAAAKAGFDAVECHFPYVFPAQDLREALTETGLPMICINTRRGNIADGDIGLTAVAGRETEARAAIDEAIVYAAEIGCTAIHAMAGRSSGNARAQASFHDNLAYAAERAAPYGITILIEPLNRHDVPSYHLRTVEEAQEVIRHVGARNLKLMFDCYHVQRLQGDVMARLRASLPYLGHIQIANSPDRGAPDAGELNYPWILEQVESLGWQGYVGAEYNTGPDTDASLAWLAAYR